MIWKFVFFRISHEHHFKIQCWPVTSLLLSLSSRTDVSHENHQGVGQTKKKKKTRNKTLPNKTQYGTLLIFIHVNSAFGKQLCFPCQPKIDSPSVYKHECANIRAGYTLVGCDFRSWCQRQYVQIVKNFLWSIFPIPPFSSQKGMDATGIPTVG